MKYMKYTVLLVLIILTELILIYAMFAFVTASKFLFVLSALVLIAGVVVYLVIGRHREKTKIKPKAEVWDGYFRVFFVVFVVFFSVLAGAIIIRGLVFLIRGI